MKYMYPSPFHSTCQHLHQYTKTLFIQHIIAAPFIHQENAHIQSPARAQGCPPMATQIDDSAFSSGLASLRDGWRGQIPNYHHPLHNHD